MFGVPQVALDYLPRVIRPDRNRVIHRVCRGPGPRYRRTGQDQGLLGPQHLNQFWERRVVGACEYALHLDRDGTAFSTRLPLFWIWKVIAFPC